MNAPYASAAQRYRDAGWIGVIPLPARRKAPPSDGWTGHHGEWPSGADVQAWVDGPEASGNIALRLPRNVVGIDIDNYNGKQGGQTFWSAVQRWGPLPPTWRSTNRDDDQGSILYFRVPEGLAWPGELGPGVEIIQFAHRYAVVWPSIHPEGREYRWVDPDGNPSRAVPHPETLPPLPDSWLTGLTGGAVYSDLKHAGYDSREVADWLAKLGEGEPCRVMQHCLEDYRLQFDGSTSRHDAARSASHRIVKLAAKGHSGMTVALARIEHAFIAAVSADRTRPADPYEWQRMVDGAVQLAAGEPVAGHDPCQTSAPSDDDAFGLGLLRDLRVEPVAWRVEGILQVQGRALVIAQKKLGKTHLALNLSHSLLTGEEFLGQFAVERVDRIGYINGEVSKGMFAEWCRDVGIPEERLVVANTRGRINPLRDDGTAERFADRLCEFGLDVLILDTFGRFFSGKNQNDATDVTTFTARVDMVAERSKIGEIVLVAHAGWSESGRARGSSSLEDWPDSILRITGSALGPGRNASSPPMVATWTWRSPGSASTRTSGGCLSAAATEPRLATPSASPTSFPRSFRR